MGNTTSQHKSTAPVPTHQGREPQAIFMATMLGMSWQLAIVVLVPIVGGYKLDSHFKTSPLFTLIGLAIAMVGMVVIVWRSLKELNKYMMTVSDKEPKTKE